MESLGSSSGVNIKEDLIDDATSIGEITYILVRQGCSDLTSSINLATGSDFPMAGGGYSDVYRGALHDGTIIALKCLRVYDGPKAESKMLRRAARELYYWSKLKHPNVLPLLGFAIFRGGLSMVSEWVENGNLPSYLRLKPDVDRVKLCMDICKGLCYIHAKHMVHGDLKGANILVALGGSALIAGFGNARPRDPNLTLAPGFIADDEECGISVRWAAPELFEDTGPQVSKEADVYAYGMTVLEVLTGKVPFEGKSDMQVISSIYSGERPPRPGVDIHEDLQAILNSCWARKAAERPTILTVKDSLQSLVQTLEQKSRQQEWDPTRGTLDRRGASMDHKNVIAPMEVENIQTDYGAVEGGSALLSEHLSRGSAADVWRQVNLKALQITHRISGDKYVSKAIRVSPGDFSGLVAKSRGDSGHQNEVSWEHLVKKYKDKVSEWVPLNHDNVIRVYELQHDLRLLVEYCPNGSVREYLKAHSGQPINKLTIVSGVLLGLQYLHNKRIIHGSLNAGKVFIDAQGRTKIGEFGLAALCYHIAPLVPSVTFTGFSRWMSPELFDLGPDGDVRPTLASDVWALACTMYEIISERLPYPEYKHDVRVQRAILKGEHPGRRDSGIGDAYDSKLWSTMEPCWAMDPSQRPSIEYILDQVPWDESRAVSDRTPAGGEPPSTSDISDPPNFPANDAAVVARRLTDSIIPSGTGIVKMFNQVKGHGFIAQDNGGPDVFVHYTRVAGGKGRDALNEGDLVSYEASNTGKGPAASLVTRMK